MAVQPVMRDWRDIARVIRQWLARTGTKQEELAIQMGHADGSELSRYMNGKKPWYPPNLHRVAEIIGVDPVEFYHWPHAEQAFLAGRDAADAIYRRHLELAALEVAALDYVKTNEADEPVRPNRKDKSKKHAANGD